MRVCVENRRILDYVGGTELGQEATYLNKYQMEDCQEGDIRGPRTLQYGRSLQIFALGLGFPTAP